MKMHVKLNEPGGLSGEVFKELAEAVSKLLGICLRTSRRQVHSRRLEKGKAPLLKVVKKKIHRITDQSSWKDKTVLFVRTEKMISRS